MKKMKSPLILSLGFLIGLSLVSAPSVSKDIPVLDRSIKPFVQSPKTNALTTSPYESKETTKPTQDELKVISIVDSHLDEDTLKRIARSHALFNRYGLNCGVLLLGLDLRHIERSSSGAAPKPIKSLEPFMAQGVYFAIDPVTISRIEREVAHQGRHFGVPSTVFIQGNSLFVALGGTPRLAVERFLEGSDLNHTADNKLSAIAEALRLEGL